MCGHQSHFYPSLGIFIFMSMFSLIHTHVLASVIKNIAEFMGTCFISRFSISADMGFLLEGAGYNIRQLHPTVHSEVSSQEVFSSSVL